MTPPELTRRRMLALTSVAAGSASLGGAGSAVADGHHENEDVVLESHDGTELAATVYRPAGATADDPVPMILHSHGWGGSRQSGDGAFGTELDRGFGVLSFDQRGHGDSGGEAHVQNPDLEGRDVIEVLDHVESMEWVARSEATGEHPACERADPPGIDCEEPGDDDPMVFAIGGSYGGAYQLVGAFTETRERGYTRFDALAPEITWFDLSESLAPRGVVRTAWVLALYAIGVANVPDHVHEGFVYGTTTGQWPDGSLPGEPDMDARFSRNGPSSFVEDDVRLDVPILAGQGTTDNLFNLNQAWHNFERGLTEDARAASAVVGYNGGHALPNVLPLGEPLAAELGTHEGVCSGEGGFAELRLEFFEAIRDGEGDARDLVGSPYAVTTADGERCLGLDSLDDRTTMAAGLDLELSREADGDLAVVDVDGVADRIVATGGSSPGEYDPETVERLLEEVEASSASVPGRITDDLLGEVDASTSSVAGVTTGGLLDDGPAGGTVVSPTGAGVPIHVELAEGELTVGGVPKLSAEVTTVGVEQRLFFALSVGESPATATVVQNNVMPLREPEPVVGESRTVELPGVAVDVDDGENLYLTISPVSDMSFGHGSTRTPGSVILEDLTVDVPLVD